MGALPQASYALGYNLAIEYLADYEKTWMLDSFHSLNASVLAPAGRPLHKWLFLEVRGPSPAHVHGKTVRFEDQELSSW